MRPVTILTLLLIAAGSWVTPAAGQIPPGFELVQITSTPELEFDPRINNRGQILYWVELTQDPNSAEVMFYEDGRFTQITNDNVRDWLADFNDDGTIVWSRHIGPSGPYGPTSEIMMYSNGVMTRLTDDAADDYGPRINNLGHVVWTKVVGSGCGGGVFDIYFYDGQSIRPITTDAIPENVANQAATINDNDEIAWTRYDFCVSPWSANIMFHSGGQTIQVSPPGDAQQQSVSINNLGQVAWSSYIPAMGRHGVWLWENGQARLFTDWGRYPELDDAGNLAFTRSPSGPGLAQSWLYRAGVWYELTQGPLGSSVHDMAGNGELTLMSGPGYPDLDIRYLRRMPLGDLNCDGRINGADIDPFFLALGDPQAYAVLFPECDPLLGDMNGDGRFNGADIDPFFDCLGSGGCP